MSMNRFGTRLLKNILTNNGLRACSSLSADRFSKLKVSISSFPPTNMRFYSNDSSNDDHLSKEATISPEVPEPLIKIERDTQYHIMSIGINRPNKRNCVNYETSEALLQAFLDFEADDEMNVAILYGEGGNFCAGYDLEELSDLDEGNFADKIAHIAMGKGPMGPTRLERSKPSIAAISGYAVAGGMELALTCDIRIMEESSQTGLLNRRFGVPLIDGGSIRLPEYIGLSRAMDLIITGRLVSAKEAFEFGIANRLVKDGTAYGRAFHLAQEISKHPQECLKADKKSAYFSTFSSKSLEDSFHYENENAIPILQKESIEGAKKFVKGLGKHGKFNVSPTVEPEEWQKEFAKLKEEKSYKE